jgi:hypothetical protein
MPNKRENQDALLKKVDALLKRHRDGAAGLGKHDLDVPILTDKVDDEPKASPPLRVPAKTATRKNDKALEGLAADIYDRVLEKLNDRIAAQIERAIHPILLQAGSDLKGDLMQSMSDAIADALAEKIAPAAPVVRSKA